MTDDILSGTGKLLAMRHAGTTVLWGRNGSNELFYLSCPNTDLALPGSWSALVIILTGIERISTYVNRADGGNTVFASGNGKLQGLVQANSDAGRIWRAHEIKLASSGQKKSLSFNSYTTTIHVTDELDLPAKNVVLTITANTRTPVYMNGFYYVLGRTPTHVHTDAMGSVTVIQATVGINSAILTVSMESTANSITISPMDKSFAKLTALDSVDKLRDARIPSKITSGGVTGSPGSTPLIVPTTDPKYLETIAEHMDALNTLYKNVKKTKSTAALASRNHGVVPSTFYRASRTTYSDGFLDWIATAAGDLYNWLKTGVKAVINFAKDKIHDAWHFVATIAGKTYHAVLDG